MPKTISREHNDAIVFGAAMSAVIPIIFGLLIPRLRHRASPSWPWIAGWAFALVTWLFPKILARVYPYWMRFAGVVGRFNSRVMLGIVFFAVVTPLGALVRLFRPDAMRRGWDKDAASYRVLPENKPSSFMNTF